jgi:TusA-related sulfurtransferase
MCPQPIIDLAAALRNFPREEQFLLRSDDIATWHDLSAWSRMTGHSVMQESGSDFRITRISFD